MEWVETTGRTVAEAKDAALDQLGVDEHDAEFEILAEPKSGLFGRLRAEARVRARVRPTRPRAKEGRRGRARGEGSRGGRSRASGGSTADESSGQDADDGEVLSTGRAAAPRATVASDEPGRGEGQTSGRRRSGSRGRRTGASGGAAGRGAAVGAGRADDERGERLEPPAGRSGRGRGEGARTAGEEDVTMNEDVPLDEQGEVARQFLVGLLDQFDAGGSDVQIRQVDEETVELAITGEDLGLLIGPKGATLQAVQELTRTVVQRQTGGHNGRLLVDVAGYREKRKAALERFAQEVAEEVLSTATRRVLEPMQPADRKIVHDLINTIDGVTTTSEGEEPRRRVVILPSG